MSPMTASIAAAFAAARQSYDLVGLNAQIDALDNKISGDLQLSVLVEALRARLAADERREVLVGHAQLGVDLVRVSATKRERLRVLLDIELHGRADLLGEARILREAFLERREDLRRLRLGLGCRCRRRGRGGRSRTRARAAPLRDHLDGLARIELAEEVQLL